jgi:hypothetical protein
VIRVGKCVYLVARNNPIRYEARDSLQKYQEMAAGVAALLSFVIGEMQVGVGQQRRLVHSARLQPCWATSLALGVSGRPALVVWVDSARCIRWVYCRLLAFYLLV